MEHVNAVQLLETIKKQRNVLAITAAISLISSLLLIIMLFSKDSKTILLPSVVSREYTLTQSALSNAYIEDVALDVSQLLLNVTPETAFESFKRFLKHVDPASYAEIKQELSTMHQNIKKKKVTTAFFPTQIKSSKSKQVILTGLLKKIVSGTVISEDERKYLIKFKYKSGRLTITSFKELVEDKNEK